MTQDTTVLNLTQAEASLLRRILEQTELCVGRLSFVEHLGIVGEDDEAPSGEAFVAEETRLKQAFASLFEKTR